MESADLVISPKYFLDNSTGPIATITDATDYSGEGISNSQVKGNVTAKRGSTIFHGPGNYVTPDINRGTTDNVSFFLPLTSGLNPRVINGAYDYTYTVQVTDQEIVTPETASVTAPGASPFTTLQLSGGGASANATLIRAALTAGTDVKIKIYAGVTLITTIALTSCSVGGLLTFPSVTTGSFASVDGVTVLATLVYTKDFSYSFCDVVPAGCVQATWDCLLSQMTALDTTQYPGNLSEDVNRTLTINFPTKRGTPVDTPATTTQAAITIGPDIWSGGYHVELSSVLQWEGDDGLFIQDAWLADDYPIVNCNNSLCNLSSCINSLRVQYEDAVSTGSQFVISLKEQNFRVGLYLRDYSLAVQCSDSTAASSILTQLSTYLRNAGCSCGCSDNVQGEPTLIPATIGTTVQTAILSYS